MAQPVAAATGFLSPVQYPTPSHPLNQWFEVIAADTPELREKAYHLRYQVYCRENQFETPEEHPCELEQDLFDSRALHSLVIDRTSGAATGTVRLILPDPRTPEASFPIQHVCRHPLPPLSSNCKAAEISRFAISKKIRKVAEQPLALVSKSGEGNPAMAAKAMKCSLTLLLMREIVRMSRANEVTDWFAVMEPALLRLLSRFGIHFNPVGPEVEYHGLRQPCHARAEVLLGTMRREQFDIWKFIAEPHARSLEDRTAVGI
jgi:N-acyl amino acid synthase of PEP-CTERM/exosortase system